MEPLQVHKHTAEERAAVLNMLKSKRKPMTQHAGLPVKGYQAQPQGNVDVVNKNKEVEEAVLRLLDGMKLVAQIDQRWLAIGRTHIEEGFMAINRAVFKPGRVTLAGDADHPADLDMRKGPPETGTAKERVERMVDPSKNFAEVEVPPKAKQDDIVG